MAVLRGDGQAVGGAGVGPAAVPERADEEHTRAGRHDDRQRLVVRARPPLAPSVAAWIKHCRAVVGGEVVDGPDRRGGQRLAGTGDRVEAVIMVGQLRGLTGLNIDGLQGRKQVVGHQQPIEHGQHPRMADKWIADPRSAQHAVNPLSVPSLKRVASRVPEPRMDDVADLLALLRGEQVLPNEVAVALQRRHIGLDHSRVDRGSAAGRPLVPQRQIAAKVFQRCVGLVGGFHVHSSLAMTTA